MKKSEVEVRFQEMHFLGGMRCDQVLRSLRKGTDREVLSSLYELDRDRVGQPTSIGGTYEEGYFSDLDSHIDELRKLV